ncbi:MAG: FAD-dependent oxidoreductase [Waddliaceae bacterium]
MIRIAIVGGGFSGLASAWNLLRYQEAGASLEIVLFDPADIGDNASGVAAGLLHPYPGPRAKLAPKGIEGQTAAIKLMEIASNALGIPVAEKTGQLRPALTTRQKEDFLRCASMHDDVHWHDDVPYRHIRGPGIFIESSYLVRTEHYLSGLWKACQDQGVRWEKQEVASLAELEEFDLKVIAAGYAVTTFPELSFLPVKPVKGQILEIEWPSRLSPLPFPVNSGVYLVRQPDPSRCIVGATFEHSFSGAAPDLSAARRLLQKKMAALLPALADADIVDCRAGIRAYTPDHLPLIKKIGDKTWVFTGLGSKGLLYHALYAQTLARQVMESVRNPCSSCR